MKYEILTTESGTLMHQFTAAGNEMAKVMFEQWVDKREETAGANLAGEYTLVDDAGNHIATYKKGGQIWFDKAVHAKKPDDLGGWSAGMPVPQRRKLALSSRRKNQKLNKKYLSAARALQALANVTQDVATKQTAQADANYFFAKVKGNKMRDGGSTDSAQLLQSIIDYYSSGEVSEAETVLIKKSKKAIKSNNGSKVNSCLSQWAEYWDSDLSESEQGFKEQILKMKEGKYRGGGDIHEGLTPAERTAFTYELNRMLTEKEEQYLQERVQQVEANGMEVVFVTHKPMTQEHADALLMDAMGSKKEFKASVVKKMKKGGDMTTDMVAEVMYRDGANYKKDYLFRIPKGANIKEGEDVSVNEFGITDEHWYDKLLPGEYDAEYDHNIVEVQKVRPYKKGDIVSFEQGGITGIPNNYSHKTGGEVWNAWNYEQRKHFLLDHLSEEHMGRQESAIKKVADKSWEEIYDIATSKNRITDGVDYMTVVNHVKGHVRDGQYARGGKITEDQWWEQYKPEINKVVRAKTDQSIADTEIAPWSGTMYETFGEEVNHVVAVARNPKTAKHVWTLTDDGEIAAGYWLVNRQGYFITEKPWTNKDMVIKVEGYRNGGKVTEKKEHGGQTNFHWASSQNHGKDPRLASVSYNDLDTYEQHVYDDMKKYGHGYAIQLIINQVEGDYSQLSPKLAQIAREQDSDAKAAGIMAAGGQTQSFDTPKSFFEVMLQNPEIPMQAKEFVTNEVLTDTALAEFPADNPDLLQLQAIINEKYPIPVAEPEKTPYELMEEEFQAWIQQNPQANRGVLGKKKKELNEKYGLVTVEIEEPVQEEETAPKEQSKDTLRTRLKLLNRMLDKAKAADKQKIKMRIKLVGKLLKK